MRIQNKKHGPNLYSERRERIQSFETRRLRTCLWRRKGDNSRVREKRAKTDLFKQTLKVMFHIITRAYESCFACRTLISN